MIAQVSVFPIGKGVSIGPIVAAAVREIDKSGLEYRLTAMGTILEGEWEPLMKVLKRVHRQTLKKCGRVYMTIALDDRKGKKGLIVSKVRSVERLLGASRRA